MAARRVTAQDPQLLRHEVHNAQCCVLGLLELQQLLQQQRAMDLERALQGGFLEKEGMLKEYEDYSLLLLSSSLVGA